MMKIFRFGTEMFAVCTLLGMLVLVPVNATDDNSAVCYCSCILLTNLINTVATTVIIIIPNSISISYSSSPGQMRLFMV